jgi:hypothetical protein
MKFELTQALEIIEGILKSNVNHAKYDELLEMKKELEQKLQELNIAKCDFCDKPCGNDYCSTKEEK